MSKVSVDFRNDNHELLYDKWNQIHTEIMLILVVEIGHLAFFRKNNRKKKYSSSKHLRTKEIDLDVSNPNELRRSLVNLLNYMIDIVNKLDNGNEK